MKWVAAFRTHVWDDDIAESARRFFAAVPTMRRVVLVDETRGALEIPGYEKISHTDDASSLGLPNHPIGQSLWFNGDYAFYFLRRALPDYDYYLLSEYDVAVNLGLEPLQQLVGRDAVDFVAHRVIPSTADWYWHQNGLSLSDAPWKSLIFFSVLSARAIDRLLAARQALAERFRAGELRIWPFCETFIPTVLKSMPDMRFAEVSAFAKTDHFAFRPRLSAHDPRVHKPGSLAHPVFGGKRFILALLSQHEPRSFFDEGSELRAGLLSQAPFEDVVEPLRRAFVKTQDHAAIPLLLAEARTRGWRIPPASADLAFCKPAVSSSTSRWSRFADCARDACGANGDAAPQDYGFHTAEESNPWWMVDLGEEYLVDTVAIVNRPKESGRFRSFRIDTSTDGASWSPRYTQTDPIDVSSDIGMPLSIRLADAPGARFVRIVLLGLAPLHLRRVQVFGRPAAG